MNTYNKLATYLRLLLTTPTHIKSVIYDPSFPLNVASSYSILSSCMTNYPRHLELKHLIEKKEHQQISNPYLFSILISEITNTGKIKGGGHLKRLVMNNLQLVKSIVGSIKTTTKKKVQIRVRNGEVPDWLESHQKDLHIPNLFDFSYEEYSQFSKLYNITSNPSLVIQSKSSCLPAKILFQGLEDLNSYKGFDVIDCCAAPGNKTIQLAEYLKDKGVVYAFEKDPRRCEVLHKRVAFYGVKNIVVIQGDFLTTDPKDKRFVNVKFVLADPSCSGSGMLSNQEKDFDAQQQQKKSQQMPTSNLEQSRRLFSSLTQQQKTRVLKLKDFQVSILKHASRFNPLRLVYSTCSIYEQEDEEVVQEFLKQSRQYSVKGIRNMQGLERSSCGGIRMWPFDKQTDGFFVCLFRRSSNQK